MVWASDGSQWYDEGIVESFHGRGGIGGRIVVIASVVPFMEMNLRNVHR